MKTLIAALAALITTTTVHAEIYVNGQRQPNMTLGAISCKLENGVEFSSTGPRFRNHLPVSSSWFGFQKDFSAQMEEYGTAGEKQVTIYLEPLRMFDYSYKLTTKVDLAQRAPQKVEGVMSNTDGNSTAASCDLTLDYNDEQY